MLGLLAAIAIAVASPQPVIAVAPAPQSYQATAYPTITANIRAPRGVSIATLHMTLDAVDVSRDVSFAGTSVTYIPRRALGVGTHNVVVSGALTNGRPFTQQWSFDTTLPADQSAGLASSTYDSYGSLQLSVGGSIFGPNQYMPVQLVAPPGGQAYVFVCNSPWQYPMTASPSSPFYSATLQAPWSTQLAQCPVTAMYVSPTGQVYFAPYPVFITFNPGLPYVVAPYYAPAPVPTATPARYRPGPVVTRAPSLPVPQATVAPRISIPRTPVHIGPPIRVIAPRPMPVRTAAPLRAFP